MGIFKGAFIALVTALALSVLPWIIRPSVPADLVFGSCTKEFSGVEEVYRANFASGVERGSALSVYHRGRVVCDMWGGYADDEISRPWQKDSLSTWFSTTKAVGAITVLMLVDKGLLDVKKPMTHYWPEFGKHGKEDVTVETVLSHAAGLAALDNPVTYNDILSSPERVSKAFEEQVPNWTPGTKHGYHAFTIGLLMDQLIRRVDPKHRSLQQYFNEEIAEPHNIEFFIGTPVSEHHRAVRIHNAGLMDTLGAFFKQPALARVTYQYVHGNDLAVQSLQAVTPDIPQEVPLDYMFNWPEFRVVPLASAHGMGTARELAKLLGIVAHGGLFKPSTLQLFKHPVRSGVDVLMTLNVTMGYGLTHFFGNGIEGVHLVGAPGHGGQMGFADVDRDISYAYTTNHLLPFLMTGDERFESVIAAVYKATGKVSEKN